MSLSLKAELDAWAAALKAYDEQDFANALYQFSRIADSSKILTNMGIIYATVGEHETAVEHFVAATNLDSYLAIAHFQCGVSNFLLGCYDYALLNFEDAYLYLRGNEAINYEQIGLKFKLFSAEIMFNKGLTKIHLGYVEEGLADMREASKQKVTNEHGVIDEAIEDRAEGFTVFSIPVGVLYRPSENKLKNSKSKDYLGKAKLVAASDSSDAFTEFTGVKKLRQGSGENNNGVDKPDEELSVLRRSATVPSHQPVTGRPGNLGRSRTALQLGAGVGRGAAAILASRRTQSVSNPVNVPLLPPSSSSSALSRSNTTQSTRPVISAGVMPLKVRMPSGTAGEFTGVGAGSSRASGEAVTATSGGLTRLRSQPSLRRLKEQGAPLVVQQSAPHSPLQSFQPVQHVNGVTPLLLPASPPPAQGGHLTRFYETYIDVYMDDPARPPIAQAQSGASPPLYSREQQRPSGGMQSGPSSVRASSNTSSSSGMSRAPSSAANVGTGGANATKGRTSRKRPTRRTTRKAKMYDDDDEEEEGGDDDEFEMANVRVKLHYRGDVRGMAIPPTTSFDAFVERVTAKFGTSLMGLGMKFMDEDGTRISLRDAGDFDLAIETARGNARGWSEGKIEVWCVDV